MKSVLALALAAVCLCVAAPAFAGDGNVSGATLSALGLSGMQRVSDAEGMLVRGKANTVAVKGTSLIFGQLLTPDTKNFLVASSVNEVDGTGSTGADPIAIFTHLVFLG